MMIKPESFKQVALILETNNLRGDAPDSPAVLASLKALLSLYNQQIPTPVQLGEFIITHDGLPETAMKELEQIAGRAIHFVLISESTGYYEAKNQGFLASSSPVVVFADADCTPQSQWLYNLLEPLLSPSKNSAIDVVAGRTTYQNSVFGAAASSIDFMYFPNPAQKGSTRNFYANDIAFRREIFAQHAYQGAEKIYRGHCQKLGLHLLREGIVIQYAHQAHTVHAYPNSLSDLIRLRLLRGQDSVGLTPDLIKTYWGKKWLWLTKLGPVLPLFVLFSRLGFSLGALGKQGLSLKWWQWPASALCMLAISVIDMIGALFAGLGIPLIRNSADSMALDYTHK